jgi:hypothetical protein
LTAAVDYVFEVVDVGVVGAVFVVVEVTIVFVVVG